MARPKLDNEKKLSKRFIFRLSEKELVLLHTIAAGTGKSPAIAVREKLFKGKFPKPKIARIDLQTFMELRKIGVNINQLTKKVNSNIFPFGLKDQLARLLEQQQTIINLLMNDSESEDR